MPYCTKCGKRINDSSNCPKCNALVQKTPQAKAPIQQTLQRSQPVTTKSNNGLVAVLAVIGIAILVAIIGASGKSSTSNLNNLEQPSTQTAPPLSSNAPRTLCVPVPSCTMPSKPIVDTGSSMYDIAMDQYRNCVAQRDNAVAINSSRAGCH